MKKKVRAKHTRGDRRPDLLVAQSRDAVEELYAKMMTRRQIIAICAKHLAMREHPDQFKPEDLRRFRPELAVGVSSIDRYAHEIKAKWAAEPEPRIEALRHESRKALQILKVEAEAAGDRKTAVACIRELDRINGLVSVTHRHEGVQDKPIRVAAPLSGPDLMKLADLAVQREKVVTGGNGKAEKS